MSVYLALALLVLSVPALAKEIALTFDDAPVPSSGHMTSLARTKSLIEKLKANRVPSVMVFANPCKDPKSLNQMQLYVDAGHRIGNHTCSHPRFEEVGFAAFAKDALEGDQKLAKLLGPQKIFRFPYFNEHSQPVERDKMRQWLAQHSYRNGVASIDNDDYLFSGKINQAQRLGKKIDYVKVEKMMLDHLMGAVEFYDDLAVKTIGRSPKHVILLHEVDATVMFIDSFVKRLRDSGWTIIGVDEAYKDPIYLEAPKNTYANNGLIAQLAMDKTGERIGYNHFDRLKRELEILLGLR